MTLSADQKCCVCGCTNEAACLGSCMWAPPINYKTSANSRKPSVLDVCTTCAPILLPLMAYRRVLSPLTVARKIRKKLDEEGALFG